MLVEVVPMNQTLLGEPMDTQELDMAMMGEEWVEVADRPQGKWW